MVSSQAINLTPPALMEAAKNMRNSAREAKQGMFDDMLNRQMTASPARPARPHSPHKPDKQTEQPLAEEQPLTEPKDNLYTFPTPPPTDPETELEQPDKTSEMGEKVWVPHPSLLKITQALVSVLEGYPNNKPAAAEIVPLLEEYARQLAQLEQPLPPKVAELQSLIEEVLARTPQNQDIVETTQQTDKLAQLFKMLRGNLSPLENANENTANKGTQETGQSLFKPVTGEQKASADKDAGQQYREHKPEASATAHTQQAAFRVDVAPNKVFFADAMQAANGTPRFTPLTPESLFNTMVDRIAALPGADPHMEIALKPDHLGKLTIDLSLGEQGLTAKIIASDEGVRNMLAAHLNRLSETLAEKGIRVENVEIVYSPLADKQSDQRQPARQEQGSKDNSYRPSLMGVADKVTGGLENAYVNSPYMDEWGTSSVEYQA